MKMLVLKGGFLDGWRGFVVAVLGAFYVFLRYAKLWELIHVQGKKSGEGEKVVYGRRGQAEAAASSAASEAGAEEAASVPQAEEAGAS